MSRRFPILAVLLLSFCGSVQVDAGFPGAVEDHVQRAKAIAGSDLKSLPELVCRPAPEQVPYAIKNIPGFLDPKAPGIEPFAAFDNLYYVGPYAVGSWILDTGDGLIVFDALNNEGEVKNILLPGMRKLGLDPNDMKYLVITHAHFDHYGGAKYLKDQFGVRIMMSALDWDALKDDIALPYAIRAGYPRVEQPARDFVIEDGYVLELGDSSVRFVITPGHTPGTLSSVIKVKDNGKDEYIGMWGGQALREEADLLTQMHESLHKFWNIAKDYGVEGAVSTHAWVVGSFELQSRGASNGENPMLIGAEGFDRIMTIFDECIRAQFARTQ